MKIKSHLLIRRGWDINDMVFVNKILLNFFTIINWNLAGINLKKSKFRFTFLKISTSKYFRAFARVSHLFPTKPLSNYLLVSPSFCGVVGLYRKSLVHKVFLKISGIILPFVFFLLLLVSFVFFWAVGWVGLALMDWTKFVLFNFAAVFL